MTAPTQPDPAVALGKLAEGALDGDWKLDPSASSARLRTASMWGMMKIKGEFSDLAGEASVVDGSVRSARIVVGAASIDTKNAKRDKHLRSADFLDVDKYPSIIFEVNSIAPSSATVTAHGRLTVGEVTKPISVEVAPTHNSDSRVTLTADFEIDRRDYGLTWNQIGMASMTNMLTVTAVFTRG